MTETMEARRSKRWTLVAVILGSAIVFLDSTIVSVAAPTIAEQLPGALFTGLEAQAYIYNGYLLTLSALLVLAGAITDRFGRKRTFAIGLAGFGITSLMCGLAPNMELLVVFRILQGAAGALLVPGSLAIITNTFEGEERGRAFGVWAGASAATTILGPFVAGVLVDGVSWRAAFLINVPLLAVALVALIRYTAESIDEEHAGRFDLAGAVMIALAVGGLTFGAIRGEQSQWQTSVPFISLAIGAIALVALPIMMLRSKDPLVPPSLFKSRNFNVINVSTLLIYGALYVTFYFLTIFLQGTLGYSPAAAGLAVIPSGIFLALGSTRVGRIAARTGPRRFLVIGPSLMALGVVLLAFVPADAAGWVFGSEAPGRLLPPADYAGYILPGLTMFGIGLMLMVAPLTTVLMNSVPERNSGVASAVNNAISRVGPQLAGAAIFVAIAATFYSGVGERVPTLDVGSARVRQSVAPLNAPPSELGPDAAAAVREESTRSLALAMFMSAGLLVAGAAVNGLGLARATPGETTASRSSPDPVSRPVPDAH